MRKIRCKNVGTLWSLKLWVRKYFWGKEQNAEGRKTPCSLLLCWVLIQKPYTSILPQALQNALHIFTEKTLWKPSSALPSSSSSHHCPPYWVFGFLCLLVLHAAPSCWPPDWAAASLISTVSHPLIFSLPNLNIHISLYSCRMWKSRTTQ